VVWNSIPIDKCVMYIALISGPGKFILFSMTGLRA
jgi:hypothetical protein